MSALLHIKNLIMSRLEAEPDLKAAIMGVMNAIDSDLDDAGYETSFETDEAIASLDKVLTGVEEEEYVIVDNEVLDNNTDALLEDMEKDHDIEGDADDDDDDDDRKV